MLSTYPFKHFFSHLYVKHFKPPLMLLAISPRMSSTNDQIGAQTRHPGGVAFKKASVQKGNPSRSDNRSGNNARWKGWIMIPAPRKLHRIGLWLPYLFERHKGTKRSRQGYQAN
ncbi:Uncharacterized protein HZ326_28988 [Fusarium oxysporum f. sp. albedinis]|nr:Uncharacterized protein HZ326_28988 [Fusarium oxysporum f. sp. albedinis]